MNLTGGGVAGSQRLEWIAFTKKLLKVFVADVLEREIHLMFWVSLARPISTYILWNILWNIQWKHLASLGMFDYCSISWSTLFNRVMFF